MVLREQGNALEQALAAQTQQTGREETREWQTAPPHVATSMHVASAAWPLHMTFHSNRQCGLQTTTRRSSGSDVRLQAGSRRRRRRQSVGNLLRTCSRLVALLMLQR